MINDTIAAIATASENGSISIIRISGDKAIQCVGEIFYKKSSDPYDLTKAVSHTVHYGYIGTSPDDIIDEVLVILMRSPKSYTSEDVIEIHCHGGGFSASTILNLLIEHGIRLAEPGEFTKRAFLNGRIDLTQAESVMDIINAKSDLSLRSAETHLRGDIKNEVQRLREILLSDTAYLEAALDDPEHIALDGYADSLTDHITEVESSIDAMIESADTGILIKSGIKTAIIGKPNVGKSSFLNCLLETDRAIVTDIAGTTRDTLEEDIRIGGVILHLTDTAGLRDTDDLIESIGVKKGAKAASDADFIIKIIDASSDPDDTDINIITSYPDKPTLIILNKSDIPPVITDNDIKHIIYNNIKNTNSETNINDKKTTIPDTYKTDTIITYDTPKLVTEPDINKEKNNIIYKSHIISFSCKNKDNIPELKELIKDMIYANFYDKNTPHRSDITITNLRQKEALINTKNALTKLRETIDTGMPEDLYTIDLLDAYTMLGKITGDTLEDDLVDKIFADFCMGK